jgi:hypothetical protein
LEVLEYSLKLSHVLGAFSFKVTCLATYQSYRSLQAVNLIEYLRKLLSDKLILAIIVTFFDVHSHYYHLLAVTASLYGIGGIGSIPVLPVLILISIIENLSSFRYPAFL